MGVVVVFTAALLALWRVSTILAACPDTMSQGQERCYQVKKESVSAKAASHNCFLAGIPFYELLTSGNKLQDLPLQDHYCYWVHAVYLREYTRTFGSNSMFIKFFKIANRCPAICRDGAKFHVEGTFCKEKRFYICQYEESVFQPKKPVSTSSGRVVVSRASKPNKILGRPLFATRAAASTMCSRICLNSEGCVLFNFNTASRECSGYSWKASVSYEMNSSWEIWVVKKV